MRKLEHIARLNIRRPNMVKQGLVYSKQNQKLMLTRLQKNENIGLYVGFYKESNRASATRARDMNHHATRQWCVQNHSYFYIAIRAEDALKLSYKVGDKNWRENQTKPRWVWNGRHNGNGMGSWNRKWWVKVLWWSEKFPRLLVALMDVLKMAGLSWLLQLNPGARGELLNSQLSWVAAWLLVTSVCPVYLVKERCYIRGAY